MTSKLPQELIEIIGRKTSIDAYLILNKYIPFKRNNVYISDELQNKLNKIYERRYIFVQNKGFFLDHSYIKITNNISIEIIIAEILNQIRMQLRVLLIDHINEEAYYIRNDSIDINTGNICEEIIYD